jgi:mRNA interferase MazF
MQQGDIWSAHLNDPIGSEPGYSRPVVVVQGDRLNASRLATVVVVPLTSNLKWANVSGNVLLRSRPGLKKASVANVSQVAALDRSVLGRAVARVTAAELQAILSGIDFVLGRES